MAITINLVRDWEDIQLDDFQRFILNSSVGLFSDVAFAA